MDLAYERTKLLKRDAEWATAAYEGRDIETILSYWTDDAIVIPPHLPEIRGKDALREYVRASLQIPGFSITWSSTGVNLSQDGRLAYMFSNNSVTMSGPDGSLTTAEGRAVTIWRKESDDEWRCAVDIWNDGPAA